MNFQSTIWTAVSCDSLELHLLLLSLTVKIWHKSPFIFILLAYVSIELSRHSDKDTEMFSCKLKIVTEDLDVSAARFHK